MVSSELGICAVERGVAVGFGFFNAINRVFLSASDAPGWCFSSGRDSGGD